MLNPLKDKVTIIYRPGRLHNNVDPLSQYPISNSVNLVQISNEWQGKLWRGYLDDKYFRNILRKLMEQHLRRQQQQTPYNIQHGNQKLSEKGDYVINTNYTNPTEGKTKRGTEETDDVEKGGGVSDRRISMEVDSVKKQSSEVLRIKDMEVDSAKKQSSEVLEIKNKKVEKEVLETKDKKVEKEEVLGIKDGENEKKREEQNQNEENHQQIDVNRGQEGPGKIIDGASDRMTGNGKTRNGATEDQIGMLDAGLRVRIEGQVDRVEVKKDGMPETGRNDGKERNSLIEFYERTRSKDITITDGTFSLIDNCLFFSERKSATLRLCLLENLIDEVLHICHDARAHPGIRRTYNTVALRFFFPRMSHRIKRHVDDCYECQTSKPSNERPIGQLQPIKSQSPHHTLCIDYVTGLPLSHGCDALLTLTDAFTKAIRLIPCKKMTTAEETADLFLKHAYPIFGLPARIISDRDSRFTSGF